MHNTSAGIRKELQGRAERGTSSEMGWLIAFIRAAENVNLKRMKTCALACPLILQHAHPDNPEARSSEGISKLKELVVRLAREEITEEIEMLRQAAGEDDADSGSNRNVAKKNILGKLKRLLPGLPNTLGAVAQEDGSITSNPAEMAKALGAHWARTFKRKPINVDVLENWLRSLQPSRIAETQLSPQASLQDNGNPLPHRRAPRRSLPRGSHHWIVRQKDISRALDLAGNSSPGPDGIPFEAWRALGEVGLRTLHAVALELRKDSAADTMREAYDEAGTGDEHEYNLSTLVCLPKAASGEDPEFGAYFRPEDTRPLSIVNCDNRIVASAVRSRWEEQLAGFIKQRQQGFLQGRSILRNLLEVENAMLMRAAGDEDSAAIFLDFAAAFPSISQEYILRVLKEYGLPEEEINILRALYDGSRCQIAMKGGMFPGFDLSSGVRQGCPLSPLVYALAAELLLDKLEQEFEDLFVRAYADDTCLVVKNFFNAAPQLARTFNEFADISGLRLNLKKSVVIPLNTTSPDNFHRRKRKVVQDWQDMPTRDHCEYLGFMMGPGKGDSSWRQPMAKYRERIKLWKDMPLGLHWDARIYNTFLLPILMYVAQLESPS